MLTRRTFAPCALAAAPCSPPHGLPLIAAAQSSLLNVSTTTRRAAVPRLQQGLHRASPRRRSPCANPRRLGQAGARGDRRSWRPDVVTWRWPTTSTCWLTKACWRLTGKSVCRTTPAPTSSTIVFPGPQTATPNIDDWADLARDRRRGHHPNPGPDGGALELPGRLGIRAQATGRQCRVGQAFVKRIYANVKVLDSARAVPPPPSWSAASATC